MTAIKPLILTTGEPAGIGPDICIMLADYIAAQSQQPIVLCGDIELLRKRAALHGKAIDFHRESSHSGFSQHSENHASSIAVRHTPCDAEVIPGKLDLRNARYVLDTLTIAAEGAQSGAYAGIVTAPIHKGIICDTGTAFSGHTEFFADNTNTPLPVMVLGTADLKVGLVTTHLPLQDVPTAITAQRLTDVLGIIDQDMRRYFIGARAPKIGVCGLNPHAGESGHMGREEISIIDPTLKALRESGMQVSAALPADTLFVPHHAQQYDIIVAMYHDQGLPVIKAQGFGACVNMTFGLPIIRTSVDHGTALDLAGTDAADPNSLQCAVEMAKTMLTTNRLTTANLPNHPPH